MKRRGGLWGGEEGRKTKTKTEKEVEKEEEEKEDTKLGCAHSRVLACELAVPEKISHAQCFEKHAK